MMEVDQWLPVRVISPSTRQQLTMIREVISSVINKKLAAIDQISVADSV